MSALRRAVALFLLYSALAACGGDKANDPSTAGQDPGTNATATTSPNPLSNEEISRLLPGHLRIDVTGDVSFTYDEDVDLRIVVINDEDVTPIKFVSVGIEQLQKLPDGDAFRVAFDLTGDYDGEGEYVLPAIGSVGNPAEELDPDNPDANAAGRGLSKPYVTYSPEGTIEDNPAAAATAVSYENPIEDCTLVIGADDATAGSLECPKVADASGNIVGFTMEWDKA